MEAIWRDLLGGDGEAKQVLADDCVTVTGSLEARIRVRKGRGASESIRLTGAVARCRWDRVRYRWMARIEYNTAGATAFGATSEGWQIERGRKT